MAAPDDRRLQPGLEVAKDYLAQRESLPQALTETKALDYKALTVRALEMRRQRHTHREISKELGIPQRLAAELIKRALKRIAVAMQGEAEHVRTLELLRLDELERELMGQIPACGGPRDIVKVVDAVVRCMQFRAQLLNIAGTPLAAREAGKGGATTMNFISVQAGAIGVVGAGAAGLDPAALRASVERALLSAAGGSEPEPDAIEVKTFTVQGEAETE